MDTADISFSTNGSDRRDLNQENQSVQHSINTDTTSDTPLGCTYAKYDIRRKRKGYRPTKSAARLDPSFKGATVSLMTHVKDGDSYLFISAHFSNLNYVLHKRHHGSGSVCGLYGSCSGSEDDLPESTDYYLPCSSKMCASCSTRRTPLWRDAEDGTPLCNACGIRFKKYRMRCGHCWHIPKKDVKTYPNCPLCGSVLRITVGRRTSW